MAVTQQRREREAHEAADEAGPVRSAVETVQRSAQGGWLPTVFSAVAVAASCVSVYVSTLQGAQFDVYLPPAFQYAMDGEGENFTIPVTIANSGARGGTVISMELEVEDAKTKATQRFYSAYLGEHPSMQSQPKVRQFSPISVLGHSVVTETVRFYAGPAARRGEDTPRIVSGEGDYTIRLKINTASPAEPSLLDRLQGRAQLPTITVQMNLPVLDYRGLMPMRAKGWMERPAAP